MAARTARPAAKAAASKPATTTVTVPAPLTLAESLGLTDADLSVAGLLATKAEVEPILSRSAGRYCLIVHAMLAGKKGTDRAAVIKDVKKALDVHDSRVSVYFNAAEYLFIPAGDASLGEAAVAVMNTLGVKRVKAALEAAKQPKGAALAKFVRDQDALIKSRRNANADAGSDGPKVDVATGTKRVVTPKTANEVTDTLLTKITDAEAAMASLDKIVRRALEKGVDVMTFVSGIVAEVAAVKEAEQVTKDAAVLPAK